jgi:hypothetical protein
VALARNRAETGKTTRDEHGGRTSPSDELRRIWDRNAEWWDGRIGEGNACQSELVEPGMTILDVACAKHGSPLHVDLVGGAPSV